MFSTKLLFERLDPHLDMPMAWRLREAWRNKQAALSGTFYFRFVDCYYKPI